MLLKKVKLGRIRNADQKTSYIALLYKTIVALLISVLAMSSIADEIDEATQKKLESLERRIQKL